MKQESRMVLAILLCTGIYLVWSTFFVPPTPPQKTAVEQTTGKETTKSERKKIEASHPTGSPIAKAETRADEKEFTFETPEATVVLNTRGALLTSYKLKKYKTTAEKDSAPKDLLQETPDSHALFLGLKGYDRLTTKKVYEVVKQSQNAIVLAWQDDRVRIEKTFAFADLTASTEVSDYALNVRYKITNLGANPMNLRPYLQNQVTQKEIEEKSGFMSFLTMGADQAEIYMPAYFSTEDEALAQVMDWDDKTVIDAKSQWTSITDRYFFMAMAPLSQKETSFETTFIKEPTIKVQSFQTEATVNGGESIEGQYLAYIGPKKSDELKTLGHNFDAAIDYGWFGFLAEPILWLMRALYNLIPSWGLAIILLTFIVKIILYPINKKSMASMKAMQKLQPKLKDIREKYADDKQKQNEEVMHLFKTHKVNPLGGCLPMLMQLPIYFALYRVLWNAIELYHTPFLHYKDLSAPDPYFIAPILMGVFMVLQQKLTPNPSTDPAQKKMMMIMPVVFTAIMLFLPVGLVIYIAVNTAMSVFQQYLMHKDISLREVFKRKILKRA